MKDIQLTALLLGFVASCGGSSESATHAATRLTGRVSIDGSSTVFPITEAVAEEYRSVSPDVRVTVGVSGTGGGFKKFIAGETDIADASRYIKGKELDGCAAKGREFIEIPVAYDGLAVVVNKANTFADAMTVEELRRMWASDSVAKTWSDIRPEWPDREFKLFAPGQDSGTFDYFTEVVNGNSGNCRSDVTFSEDDNVLVRGVIGDEDGIAFFGLAYFVENADKLNSVGVDPGDGTPVKPSAQSVEEGTYTPLSRPLFIYVSTEAAQRPEVDDFVRFFIQQARGLVGEVGYVPMPEQVYAGILRRYDARVVGSQHDQDGTIESLYL
ncbi:MAG: phosphate transport system substrate-binding protein [Gammaproteobacteria bacterium]|jgi:phosphate transport system substrate-binding protein